MTAVDKETAIRIRGVSFSQFTYTMTLKTILLGYADTYFKKINKQMKKTLIIPTSIYCSLSLLPYDSVLLMYNDF